MTAGAGRDDTDEEDSPSSKPIVHNQVFDSFDSWLKMTI